jgi:hypothetical protein
MAVPMPAKKIELRMALSMMAGGQSIIVRTIKAGAILDKNMAITCIKPYPIPYLKGTAPSEA